MEVNLKQSYFYKKINKLMIQKYDFLEKTYNETLIETTEIIFKYVVMVEEDVLIKNSLVLLEIITGQKATGSGTYKYVGANKKFFFEGKVLLRKIKLFSFLEFLVNCCLAKYFKRNGIYFNNIVANMYLLLLIDFNIFPNSNISGLMGNLIILMKGAHNNLEEKLGDCLKILKIKK